jgi:hypothetical protein
MPESHPVSFENIIPSARPRIVLFKFSDDEKDKLKIFLETNDPILYEKMFQEIENLRSSNFGGRRSKRSHCKTRKGKSRKHRSKEGRRGRSRKH